MTFACAHRALQSLFAVAAFRLAAGAQATACPAPTPAPSGARLSLEAATGPKGDSLRLVRVCLHPAPATVVGSFHLVIEYDSLLLHAVRYQQSGSGAVVANLIHQGRVDVAGANPGGFSPGELLAVTFVSPHQTAMAGAPGVMVLRLLELNATTGANILEHAVITGLGMPADAAMGKNPAPRSAEALHLDSLTPRRAKLPGRGTLVSVTIHGSGFRPEGNAVLLADVEIAHVPSADGRVLHFVLPSAFPATGEVPPRMIGAGQYELRVRTSAGTSNPLQLTLETPQ